MRLLLDTHTFLWFVTDDPNLSKTAKFLIEDPANERFLSMASPWEIAIKTAIGRLALTEPLAEFMREQLRLNLIQLLPISLEHVLGVASLPMHHRDPFDRLLISQAIIEQMPIVSADAAFDAYPVTRRW